MPILKMDPIKIEKLQAVTKYKKNQSLNSLIFYSLTALTFTLFFSSLFWLPSLGFSLKTYLFVSLPNIGSLFFNPKFLFIVGNAIIVFLVGESKLVGSSSSPATDIYNEYVKSSQSHRQLFIPQEKKGRESKWEISLIAESVKRVEEDGEGKEEKGGGGEEKMEEVERKDMDEDSDGEEEFGLPAAEDLNKRVEDFISRINNQRRFEADQLVCTFA